MAAGTQRRRPAPEALGKRSHVVRHGVVCAHRMSTRAPRQTQLRRTSAAITVLRKTLVTADPRARVSGFVGETHPIRGSPRRRNVRMPPASCLTQYQTEVQVEHEADGTGELHRRPLQCRVTRRRTSVKGSSRRGHSTASTSSPYPRAGSAPRASRTASSFPMTARSSASTFFNGARAPATAPRPHRRQHAGTSCSRATQVLTPTRWSRIGRPAGERR